MDFVSSISILGRLNLGWNKDTIIAVDEKDEKTKNVISEIVKMLTWMDRMSKLLRTV